MSARHPLRHPMLDELNVEHGFGVRGGEPPPGTLRVKQVHGIEVARPGEDGRVSPDEADAIVCQTPGLPVAVATADCVPILAATTTGDGVAAIHAGWRGLAQGVVAAAIAALRACSSDDADIVAAVGPHIGRCCYEVDDPVLSALTSRFGSEGMREAATVTRPGHARIDLGMLVSDELTAFGVARVGGLEGTCTRCDALRFESFRRDGEGAGRMLHFIVPRSDEMYCK
jgi:YfiH family protein